MESLIRALVHVESPPSARERAAEALGKIGDAHAVEYLIQELKDSFIREAAAEALGKIGERAVEPLITMLLYGTEDDLYPGYGLAARRAAAKVLVHLYRSGRLDEAQKALILAERARITEPYKEWRVEVGGYQRANKWSRRNRGIGVDFPL